MPGPQRQQWTLARTQMKAPDDWRARCCRGLARDLLAALGGSPGTFGSIGSGCVSSTDQGAATKGAATEDRPYRCLAI
jgi:hypothetical protein